MLPTATARWSPGVPTPSARPAQTQAPSKKWVRSQPSTSSEKYAAPGNVRAAASGRVTGSSKAGSIGALTPPVSRALPVASSRSSGQNVMIELTRTECRRIWAAGLQ